MGTTGVALVLSSVFGCFRFFHSHALSKLFPHTGTCDITYSLSRILVNRSKTAPENDNMPFFSHSAITVPFSSVCIGNSRYLRRVPVI